jgi:hypothetical protein
MKGNIKSLECRSRGLSEDKALLLPEEPPT